MKTMLLLCALIVGSGSVWAADADVTFTFNTEDGISALGISKPSSSAGTDLSNSTSYTINGVNMAVTHGGTNTRVWNSSGTLDLRIYKNGGSLTFTAPGNITKIVLTGDAVTNFSTTVGSFSAGTWEGDAESVTLTATNTGKINTITVTYSVDDRTAVNITDFTAYTTTIVKGQTSTTSVTNDQIGWTPSYTYTSDDESVAEIDDEGTITAVSKGTTTVRVTLNIDKDDENYRAGNTKTMSIDITVTNPFHKAEFYVNGEKVSETSVEEGEDIEFPDDPSDMGSKVFIGWLTSTIDTPTDVKPETVKAATMGAANVIYYAVFASKAVSGGEETKSYGFETASDDNWIIEGPVRSDEKANTGSYSGRINTNNSYVKFKNKVKVKEFSFAFTRNSGNNNYNVYIETSTDNSKWESAAKYAMSSFNSDGTFSTTSKTFDGNTALYVRFHCDNTTAIRFVDDVTITYDDEVITYSAYTTTFTAYTVSTKTGNNYGSYVTTKKLDFASAEGITAYIATGFNGAKNAIVLKEVDIVPAGIPIIVNTTTQGASIDVPVTTADASSMEGNALVAGDGTTAWDGNDGYTYYYLASDLFHKATSGTLQSGKAYLKVANGDVPEARSFGFVFDEEEATGINTVAKDAESGQFFNLAGQRVAQPTKGLYIVNGRKVIVK